MGKWNPFSSKVVRTTKSQAKQQVEKDGKANKGKTMAQFGRDNRRKKWK